MKVLLALMLAQHEHQPGPTANTAIQLSQSRTASGTAWLPEAAVVPGYHRKSDGWDFMLHGSAFLQYVRVSGSRAASQGGSSNWLMAMAARTSSANAWRIRVMVTAEPFTLTGRGYPQLGQVAHPYKGMLAPDRQHPHELLAEASGSWEHALGDRTALGVYAAAVGEPALGPVAFNHRPSAAYEPTAPLGHVAQDYTHESLGVVTAGVFGHRARVERSAFNGSHPDDARTNFDLQGGHLNSYAGRVTVAPSDRIVASAWLAYVAPETGDHAHAGLHKFGFAFLHTRARPAAGLWSSALIYGANLPSGSTRPLNTVLLESSLDLTRSHAVFTRFEYARRTAEELALTGSVPAELDIGAASVGYAWRVHADRAATFAAGARLTVTFLPAALEPFYGSRQPVALLAYIRLTPPTP
jgi:hypothetical protein